MTTLWDLFRESVILQGILSVGLWGAAIYLMIARQPVPDLLAFGCGAIMTFWFSAKTTKAIEAKIAAGEPHA